MDVTQPKGEVVGSITLHINSKYRVSHVEVQGSGDLVSKRMILDSSSLIFRAISQARAKRKSNSRGDAEMVKKAESRDTEKLNRYKEKKAAEKAKQDEQLLELISRRRKEVDEAERKARIPIRSPAAIRPDQAAAKKAAQEASTKLAETIAAKRAGKSEPKTEPVTAAKPKEKK